ncbi:MAG: AAA family ATPase [Okeania sp. SIO2C2]|uniref:AAA family ATPase n=1 Tax=Okeania sp. SIO2C2 TaxID=2607787 RepID=UPI0013BCCB6F|nr:AAA family ATPase [Okeania sp. SIO2C2]NEP90518.1 AAA family ATPase [Okeania sp. SIO2C2]
MISSLHLKNFKPFADRLLSFKPLTLLSGLNSTGKSSVLQALLLIRQSYQQGLLENLGLALNGELVSIGTAQDALFEGAKDDFISFEIIWENGDIGSWNFSYDREKDVLNLASQPVNSDIYESSIFNKQFHYIQAERLGPRLFLEISDFQVQQLENLGSKGEYTAHFLFINENQTIPNRSLGHPEADSLILREQVEAWMGEISPGTRLKINAKQDIDLMSLQYYYGDSNPYRSTNVGFGISYTLPILVAILSSSPGTLILIENPEAHLHPKGQSKMGQLLALAANCGVQILVETHSDHVLSGHDITYYLRRRIQNYVCVAFRRKKKGNKRTLVNYYIQKLFA